MAPGCERVLVLIGEAEVNLIISGIGLQLDFNLPYFLESCGFILGFHWSPVTLR